MLVQSLGLKFSVQVTLNGTPSVQIGRLSARKGILAMAEHAQFADFTIDTSFTEDETGGDVTGTLGYVYRINLGTGNGAAGLTGNVADMHLAIWR